jgi:hypothetical protein
VASAEAAVRNGFNSPADMDFSVISEIANQAASTKIGHKRSANFQKSIPTINSDTVEGRIRHGEVSNLAKAGGQTNRAQG